jgi:hypothetical protein
MNADPRDHLITLAVEMRRCQREYFRTRDRDALDASKKAERAFDQAVRTLDDARAVYRIVREIACNA